MSKGDWYCPNCGYLSPARVTFSETCDTCHSPVQWHEVGVPASVYEAAPELKDALFDLMEQLIAVGIASPEAPQEGHDCGQWAGTEGMDFIKARAIITKLTREA